MFYFVITITILLAPITPERAADPVHEFKVWSNAAYANEEACHNAVGRMVEYIQSNVPASKANIEASCYPTGVQEF